MNRRQLLTAMGAALAALGIKGKVEAIEAEPKPLYFVLEHNTNFPPEARKNIRDAFEALGPEFGPLLILPKGARIVPVTAQSSFDIIQPPPIEWRE